MLPPDDAPTTDESVSDADKKHGLMGMSDQAMAHQHLHPVRAATPSQADGSGGSNLVQEARKAHINDLPVEVLGIVIEEHALLEWKAPITDGAVARHWRAAALSCPRVWSHIVLEDDSMSEAGMRLWLERAGTNLQPKIGSFRTTGATGLLLGQSHRFKSLFYRGVLPVLYPISFPNLQDLTILALGDGRLDSVNRGQSFPSLRTMRLDGFDNLKYNLKPTSTFRSLQALYLHDITGPWQSILRECANSLVTLMLEACHGIAQQQPIHLPELRTLSVRRMSGLRLLQLETPVLERFHEGRSQGLRDVEALDTLLYTTVIEYGSYKHDTDLSDLIPFPNISTLALRETFQTISKILQILLSEQDFLPALRMIGIRDNIRRPFSVEQYSKLEDLVKLLKASRPNPIEVIYTNTSSSLAAPMYFAQVCTNTVLCSSVFTRVVRIRSPLSSRSRTCANTSAGECFGTPKQVQYPSIHSIPTT